MPYTPEQNGSSERENRTIVETARAMMHSQGNIPQFLWAEIIDTACYILNRTGPSSVPDMSPYELWYNKKPRIKHLRIIGSTCYAHIPDQRRKKLDKKAIRGTLIGYDNNEGYRIWNKENNKLIRSRDVIFQETPLYVKTMIPISTENPKPVENTHPVNQDSGTQTEEEIINKDNLIDKNSKTYEEIKKTNKIQLRDRSKLLKPERFGFEDYVMSTMVDFKEPENYEEAIKCEEYKEWKEAMNKEMISLKDNKTWELEDLPVGRKALPCKWVYRVKINPDGSVEKFKARLVVKGFSQKRGIGFDETFSPVVRMTTIRTLLSIAANEKLSLTQIDVSTAFLYGELEDTIYMKQPEGYSDETGRVCRLKKSLYGLKQAPRCWSKKFMDYLQKLGFKTSQADSCFFIRERKMKKIILALYVDDGLIASNDDNEVQEFLKDLKKEFKITTKTASFFLGLEINQDKDGSITVSQKHYTKKILQRFGMENCRSISTPIIKDDEDNEDKTNVNFPYRQAVGALMYLMCGTRPDIAYAISVVSRKLENPTSCDVIKVKRILRYLQGTTDVGIIYRSNVDKGQLEVFSDADHGGDHETRRSTTGILCLYSGGPVSWTSQRQSSVATSTTVAEIVAASEAAKEIIWLTRMLQDLGHLTKVPVLRVDNEATIRLAKNPEYHRRTKHIEIRHFFVRELVTSGKITILRIDTNNQLADFLTKPVHAPRLKNLCNNFGLLKLSNKGEC